MLSSKNPVVGFVACQHCGKPSPTHYPKGGPRKNKLYYNCLEHKNQSAAGVAEYCEQNQVATLEEFATKFDAFDECQVLQSELENAGLLATVVEIDEPQLLDDETEDALDLDADLPQTGTDIDTPAPKEEKGSSLAPLLLILGVLALLAIVAFMVKRKRSQKPQEGDSQRESAESQPDADSSPPMAEGVPQTGVLI